MLLHYVGFGQQIELNTVKTVKDVLKQKMAQVVPSNSYMVNNKDYFTSLSIQIDKNQTFDGVYFIDKNDTFLVSKDEHVEAINGVINSNLISFNNPISQIRFFSGKISNAVVFNFINGSKAEITKKQTDSAKLNNCLTEPTSVGQQYWRSGLNAPNYTRKFSKVKNVIIHHSAGSNTNTNYTQVVRDIYIYHTQVNGWSDIGYNYLIAQDGTIFKGRDPNAGLQDDVRGAHFCGMNTGTMGVCLLGNYTSIAPTNETIQSLMKLLSWKLDKEGVNAFESFAFNELKLGAIAGHRDGCATECPGTKTYKKIANFKNEVNSMIEACYPDKLVAGFTTSNNEIIEGESVSFTDTSIGIPLAWEWLFKGSDIENSYKQNPSEIGYYKSGDYDVRLVVRNGARSDTAIVNNLIIVKPSPFSEPAVFPVPVAAGMPLTIVVNKEEISTIEIINAKGEVVASFIPTQNQMQISHQLYRGGIYYVRYLSKGRVVKTDKIMIAN